MESGRSNYCVTEWNECFCLAGGPYWVSIILVYDPKRDDWTQLAPMKQRRAGFAILKTNKSLYAIGGDAIVERCDSYGTENCWTEVRAQKNKFAHSFVKFCVHFLTTKNIAESFSNAFNKELYKRDL